MDETSLDYNLLKTNRENNLSLSRSSPSLCHENRISMKRSTFYVVIVSVSILLIGSEILVYLLSSKNNTCRCVIPDGCFVNAKRNSYQNVSPGATAPLIRKQTTLPPSTGGQTTISTFISNKPTTKESAQDGTSTRIITSSSSQKTTAAKQGCHDNWVSYGQSCYFFSNQSVGWIEAMIRCRKQNAYLVEITSADENQFLKTHAEYLNRRYKTDCYMTTPSRYKGNVNMAYDGTICQRWDSQTPHKHTRNRAYKFPDNSLADAANYCRDPDNTEPLTWCYTTDPKIRWNYCGIYQCPGGNYWTGMVAFGGNWTWINTQTNLDQGYSNWDPTGSQLTSLNTCGSFVGSIQFQWKSKKCALPAMYICEK